MGTDKRARQKANRQSKLEEIAKQEQRSKTKRNLARLAIIPALVLAIWGIIVLVGDDGDDSASDTTVDTLAPGETLPFDTTPGATTPGDTTAPDDSVAPEDTTAALPSTTTPTTTPGESITGETPCPEADGSSPRVISFENPPPMCIDPDATYTALIETNKGNLTVELDASKAPMTVNNFVVLARYHFFENTECHRAIPNFVVQCGDPTATGTGGPGYEFDDELPEAGEYQIGSLAMANSGPNTNGSQFFIISGEDGAALPPQYSLFGQVTEGLDDTLPALDAAGNPSNNGVPPLEQIIITNVTITEG